MGIIFNQSMVRYIAKPENLSRDVLVSFFNTFNVVSTFLLILRFSGLICIVDKKENREVFSNLQLNPFAFCANNILSGFTLSLFIIAPSTFLLAVPKLMGVVSFKTTFFPIITIFMFHLFVISWMNILARIFKNQALISLLTFLIVAVFSFMNSVSDLTSNIFLSVLLKNISYISHLDVLSSGVFFLSDVIYFISWPTGVLVTYGLYGDMFPNIRRKKYITRSFGMVFNILIIIMCNFIFTKKNISFDFSNSRIMSLSDQSISAVSKIKYPITLKVFSYPKDLIGIKRKLGLYEEINDNIHIEFINPDNRPDLITLYEIRNIPAILFLGAEGKKQVLNIINEKNITSSFLQASKENMKTVAIISNSDYELKKLNNLRKKLSDSFFNLSSSVMAQDIKVKHKDKMTIKFLIILSYHIISLCPRMVRESEN